jgi:hypothetical protein
MRNFFVFYNANTNAINVLYRRRDGTYGLIEPNNRLIFRPSRNSGQKAGRSTGATISERHNQPPFAHNHPYLVTIAAIIVCYNHRLK